jgi:hypothetical protein
VISTTLKHPSDIGSNKLVEYPVETLLRLGWKLKELAGM